MLCRMNIFDFWSSLIRIFNGEKSDTDDLKVQRLNRVPFMHCNFLTGMSCTTAHRKRKKVDGNETGIHYSVFFHSRIILIAFLMH